MKMTIPPFHIAMTASLLLLLAACARSEEANLAPPDGEDYNQVEQVRTPEQDDQEIAIGDWRRSVQGDRPALEFGPAGAAALISILCDDRRGLVIQRHGAVPTGDLPMMLIQVGSETRRLAVTAESDPIPIMRATLAPSDSFIETLMETEEPITFRLGDAVPMNLPPSPAIGGYVRECANGALAAASGDAAAAPEAANMTDTED